MASASEAVDAASTSTTPAGAAGSVPLSVLNTSAASRTAASTSAGSATQTQTASDDDTATVTTGTSSISSSLVPSAHPPNLKLMSPFPPPSSAESSEPPSSSDQSQSSAKQQQHEQPQPPPPQHLLFGRQFYPPARRPPYLSPSALPPPPSSPTATALHLHNGGYRRRSAGALSGLGGGISGSNRRPSMQTASALGLDLLVDAVAAGGVAATGGGQDEADVGAGGGGGGVGGGGGGEGGATPKASRRTSLGNLLLSPFGGDSNLMDSPPRGGTNHQQQQHQAMTASTPYGYFASPAGNVGGMMMPSPTGAVGAGGGGFLPTAAGTASASSPALLPPANSQSATVLLSNLNAQQQLTMLTEDGITADGTILPTWRLKERMKTVGVGMILALNIGTDPPDVQKPNLCAKLQCWIDPTTMSRAKARERIGEKLESQYARWQQRAKLRYKRALDPTVEDVRSLCVTMRRQARNERLLLHYNGHGVPRPTADGEIYVFDKNHTHFIPLSVLDLRRWIGKPTIVVLDCSGASVLMPYLTGMVESSPLQPSTGSSGSGSSSQQQQLAAQAQDSPASMAATAAAALQPPRLSLSSGGGGSTPPLLPGRRSYGSSVDMLGNNGRMPGESETAYAARTVRDTIVLCPTSPGEILPMGPEFPADLFTSCLTTPIPVALRWFVHKNPLSRASVIDPDRVDSIPGKINDRKTPLGELNWIFTAITDTIAWNVLPSPLFQRLFRQDLIVASMFRNFLLADRILRNLNCTPMSHPALPVTHDHPLWQAWDLAVETCLDQLMRDGVLVDDAEARAAAAAAAAATAAASDGDGAGSEGDYTGAGETAVQNPQPSPAAIVPQPATSKKQPITAPFFAEQLTAFEIWLEFASLQLQRGDGKQILRFGDPINNVAGLSSDYFYMQPPEQLPVVLQVLLSQAHRVRALALLRRFLDLGNAAVNLALSVGIFPYVLKLLQSSIDEYKHVLVGIWAKILLFDSSCQADLVKDGALPHFIRHLHWGLPDAAAATSAGGTPLPQTMPSEDAAEQRTMAAVILSAICADHPPGQKECLEKNMHGFCASLLSSVEYLDTIDSLPASGRRNSITEERVPVQFRLWLCLCLGTFAKDNDSTQLEAYQSSVHLRLIARLKDESSDVRAAASYALGCLIGSAPEKEPEDDILTPRTPEPSAGMLPGMIPSSTQQVSGLAQGFLPSPGMPLPVSTSTGLNLSWQMTQQQQQQHGMQLQPQLNPQMQQAPLGPGLVPSPVLGTGTVPAGINMSQSMTPFQLQGQQTMLVPDLPRQTKPSIYEDQRRFRFDLSVAENLATIAKKDGSPTVRYEAMLSLCGFVAKYLKAFVAAADVARVVGNEKSRQAQSLEPSPSPSPKGRTNKLETIVDEGDEEEEEEEEDNDRESGRQSIPMPHGVTSEQAEIIGSLWNTLHSLQRVEPYEHLSFALSTVVSAVHENLFVLKTLMSEEERNSPEQPASFLVHSPSTSDPSKTATDAGPAGALTTPPPTSLRRSKTDSVVAGTKAGNASQGLTPSTSTSNTRQSFIQTLSDDFDAEYKPPTSKFYDWKRSEFGKSLSPSQSSTPTLLDPLSHEGAVQVYRERRNMVLHRESEFLSEKFVCLAPKPQQPRKRSLYGVANLDIINDGLNSPSAEAFEEEVTTKKQILHLRQSAMLINSGARDENKKMTSMLKFHAYEPALVVSDGENNVSLWDINGGKRINSFRNGSVGSRNTSMTWINEMTSSLLLMGGDDGTVRIYDGLIEGSGGISSSGPELVSAFVAAPDLDHAKRGGSGLVTEWQQYSGRLLAGGSSKTIHCWDLESEKCRATFESNIGSCVTTLTTAWDYTSSDLQSSASGYSGIGPEIFVAGYGNGTLKVFDIRAKLEPVSELGSGAATTRGNESRRNFPRRRRPPKLMQYAEHTSWIVNTAFTGFGGRYEIVSGCVAGDIRFWDLRIPESIRTLDVQRSPMTALACHPGIPIFATGSHAQFIKILSMDGDTLQVIRYHEEIAGQRMGPVSCLAFHPHRPILAAGATDEIISLYAPK